MINRRENSTLRDLILKALRDRAMNFWDIRTKTKIMPHVLRKQLQYLQETGAIEKVNVVIMKQPTELYQIKHGKLIVSNEQSLKNFG